MKQIVWKFRWFWDDADHAIERWLEQMAREGLHLQRVAALRTVFIFQRGEPAEVNYRIDFRLTRVDAHYLQLFQDAGWERVDEQFGWQFWRAPAGKVRVAEIFTDIESMSRKYKYLAWLFAIPLLVQLPIVFRQLPTASPGKAAFMVVANLMCFYCIARLLQRLRSLRKPKA